MSQNDLVFSHSAMPGQACSGISNNQVVIPVGKQEGTTVQNDQESRDKYWATCSMFARSVAHALRESEERKKKVEREERKEE